MAETLINRGKEGQWGGGRPGFLNLTLIFGVPSDRRGDGAQRGIQIPNYENQFGQLILLYIPDLIMSDLYLALVIGIHYGLYHRSILLWVFCEFKLDKGGLLQ